MTIAILENYVPEPNTGCWLWLRGINSDGYPLVRIDGGSFRVSRLVWEIFKGPIPEGMRVCHRCDVRLCINPEHLFLGTDKENYDDMVAKGRKARFDYAFAKLTPNDVADIRRLRKEGHRVTAIARQYGVSHSYISMATRGLRGDR
jgi:HNH endonuclease